MIQTLSVAHTKGKMSNLQIKFYTSYKIRITKKKRFLDAAFIDGKK
jgi:hypothetical protein